MHIPRIGGKYEATNFGAFSEHDDLVTVEFLQRQESTTDPHIFRGNLKFFTFVPGAGEQVQGLDWLTGAALGYCQPGFHDCLVLL